MNIAAELVVVAALSAVWLTAAGLAEGLPDAATAHLLRRRVGALLLLVGTGTALLFAVPVLATVLPGASTAPLAATLPAVPAVLVWTVTLHRLRWLRRGATAFASAPDTPAPPALRAAAAHPLLATPLQVTALAAVGGVPIAAGLVTPAPGSLAGVAVTFVALAVGAIGVRHALRHSRLAESAVRVRVRPVGRPV